MLHITRESTLWTRRVSNDICWICKLLMRDRNTLINNMRPLKHGNVGDMCQQYPPTKGSIAPRSSLRNCCRIVWWICNVTTFPHNVRMCVACVCYCAHCHVVCRRHFLHAPPLSATMLMALYLLITATAELTHTTALSRASIQRSPATG